jgi:CRISPR-associated protein Csd2
MTAHLDPTVRHDIVLLFDVTDGNPNGDPDAGNQPRTDDETGEGLVTDVALKRKIRDVVPLLKPDERRYGIFVEAGYALNTRIEEAADAADGPTEEARQRWLCERYFDVRMFGAVLSTGRAAEGRAKGAGQVRGPLQLTFARSQDPVLPSDHTITRVTQTRQEDIDKGERTEIGNKWTVPYGLYRGHAYYAATRGAKTGVNGEDLETLWTAMTTMFDHDRSATRGEMKLCGLYVYSHPDAVGVASAASLTSRVRLHRIDAEKPPRRHTDYQQVIANDDLPTGVAFAALVDLWP